MTDRPSDSPAQKPSTLSESASPLTPAEKNPPADKVSGSEGPPDSAEQKPASAVEKPLDRPSAKDDADKGPETIRAVGAQAAPPAEAGKPAAKPGDVPASAQPEQRPVAPAPPAPPAVAAAPKGADGSAPPAAQKAEADAASYVKCPNCGRHNRVGELICQYCNASLLGEASGVKTKQFGQDGRPGTGILSDTAVPASAQQASAETVVPVQPTSPSDTGIIKTAVRSAGSDVFQEKMILRLEVEGYPTPILVSPKAETILGRRDPSTGLMPDVDLTTYSGYRLGVSRKHAVIQLKQKQLEIYDLGSSNGTFVNGVRLEPHRPIVLRDGDEIILGKMVMRALFQSSDRA